ncbi:hypothetical protein CISIN_1g0381691mg, partial [Citrus sinensis]
FSFVFAPCLVSLLLDTICKNLHQLQSQILLTASVYLSKTQ